MDYRGVAVTGVWIGTAIIITAFNHYEYLAGASIPLVIVAFILTLQIIKESRGKNNRKTRSRYG